MNDRLSKFETTLKTYRREWEDQAFPVDKIIAASSCTPDTYPFLKTPCCSEIIDYEKYKKIDWEKAWI